MYPTTRPRAALASVLAVVLSFVLAGQALGFTWGRMSLMTDADLYPNGWPGAFAAAGNRLHIVYRLRDADGRMVVYQRSTDGGETWKPAVELSRASAAQSSRPTLSVDRSNIDVVWVEGDLQVGPNALWYRRSADAGGTWSAPVRLSPLVTESVGIPTVTRSGDQVVIAYVELDTGKLYTRRSSDGGQVWQSRLGIGTTPIRPYGEFSWDGVPALDFGTGVLYATWAASGRSVLVRRSLDGGATWGTTMTLETSGGESNPRVSAAGSQAMVTFGFADGAGHSYARVRKTTDKGESWSPARKVSSGTRPATSQDVLRAGGNWRITFMQPYSLGVSLWYRDSPDGVTWSDPTRFTPHTYAYPHSMGLAYHTYNSRTWVSWLGQGYSADETATVFVRGSSIGIPTAAD